MRLRGAGLRAPGFVLVVLAGTWLAHTLEYLRVWGTDGLAARLSAPLHLWMIPIGGVLLALAAAGGMRWLALHRALGERLEDGRVRIGRRLRNLPAPPPRPARPGAVPAGTRVAGAVPAPELPYPVRLAALWLALTAGIAAVYLLQENVEAAAASLRLPGMAPLLGIHAAAPLVIAATALLLAAAAVEGGRRAATAARDLETVERLLAALEGRRRSTVAAPSRAREAAPPPLSKLGAQLWRRPPPLRAPAR